MADKIQSGLGQQVDQLIARSPKLRTMIVQGRLRWRDFQIKPGETTGSSQHSITVNRKDPPLDQALGLVHELGHLLNRKPLITSGRTFQEFISSNVDAQIREEAAAVTTETQVRQELRKAGLKVPLLVADVQASSDAAPIPANLEVLIGKPAELLKVLRHAITERTGGDPLEVFWQDYYKRMRGVYKGLSQQPKSLLLPPAGGGPRFAVSPMPQPKPFNPFQGGLVSSQQRFLQEEARRRREQEALRLSREHSVIQNRRAQEEAQRRAREQQEAQRRRERLEADRRRSDELARRRAQEEAQRRSLALALAHIRKPPTSTVRPELWPRPKPVPLVPKPPKGFVEIGGPVVYQPKSGPPVAFQIPGRWYSK